MRVATLEVDEGTGEVTLTLPSYEDDDYLSVTSLLFIALANRITNDIKWVEEMVCFAEQQAASSTKH